MTAAATLLDRIGAKLREKGAAGTLRWLFRSLVYREVVSVFTERDLDLPIKPYRLPEGIVIRAFGAEDLPACRTHFARHVPVYRRLLDEGHRAFAAFDGADVAAIAWFALADYHDRDVYRFLFAVGPEEAFQFAGVVAPPYRNTAIGVQVMRVAWEALRAMGRRRLVTSADVENTPSLRMQLHLGFREQGRRLVTRFLFGVAHSRLEPYDGSMLDHLRRRRETAAAPAGETPAQAAS
jgi:RimJ/RimL family protein N-acetyltransferase